MWRITLLNKVRSGLTLHLAARQGLLFLTQKVAFFWAHWLCCCYDSTVCFARSTQSYLNCAAVKNASDRLTPMPSACCRRWNSGVCAESLMIVTLSKYFIKADNWQDQQTLYNLIATHNFQHRHWTSQIIYTLRGLLSMQACCQPLKAVVLFQHNHDGLQDARWAQLGRMWRI